MKGEEELSKVNDLPVCHGLNCVTSAVMQRPADTRVMTALSSVRTQVAVTVY